MPETQMPKPTARSPAEMILEMIEDIAHGTMTDKAKIDGLSEIGTERFSIQSPEQALKIISALGHIISSSLNPDIRRKALEAMKWIIELEVKAENKPGAPKMDQRVAGLLLEHARKEAGPDLAATASPRLGGIAATPAPSPTAKPPAAAPVVAERPHPDGRKMMAKAGIGPAAFMQLLKSVAGNDERDLRELADKMIKRIEQQATQIAPPMSAPACTEG